MRILLIRYQVCWLLVTWNGKEVGYVAGWLVRVGRCSRGTELFWGLYRAKTKFDLAKT